MRLLSSLLALLVLAGCAGVPAAPQRTALEEVQALPADLASFRRTGESMNFEAREGGAGLGASTRYVPANGERAALTVYIYDRGRPRAPEGGGSPDVAEELRLATVELYAAVGTGLYRSVRPETALDVGSRGGSPELRCANFRLVQRDGAPTGDTVCVTVVDGRFMKLRLTVWNPPEPVLAGTIGAALMVRLREIRAGGASAAPGLRT